MNPLSLIPPKYQLIAKGLAVAAVIAGLLWYKHSIYEHGFSDGAAKVQALYDDYRQQLAIATQEREKQNALKDAQVISTNEAAQHDYQIQLASIAADRDSFSQRLRNSQARSCSASLPAPEDRPELITASPQPRSTPEANGLDEYDRACREDAIQLNALILQIKGQL